MPVAVAKIAQVASVASASDARHRSGGELQRAEQPVEDVGALDDVAHEHEQRDRDQHVVRHHRIGALDEQVEDQVAHREVAEEHAERHQRERDREPEHDEDDEQGEHQHAEFGIPDPEHQMSPFRMPDLLELLHHRVFAVLGLFEHDLVELLDVMQAFRPFAGADALHAAHDLDDALHHHQHADDRDQGLEVIDRRAERTRRRLLVHHPRQLGVAVAGIDERQHAGEEEQEIQHAGPSWPACAAARRDRESRRGHGRCATAYRPPPA